jgi:hypothetical protein
MYSTEERRGPSAVIFGAWLVSLLSHDGTDCGRIVISSFASASSIGGPLSILLLTVSFLWWPVQ